MGAFLSKPQERVKIAVRKIKEVETDVFTRKSIVHLYLCKDNIVAVNRNIQLLRNLRVLQICCNNLAELPPEIGQLRNLCILFLSRNKLRKLPDEVARLKNLHDLNLSDNELTTLPANLCNLKNLKIIDISGNPMREFPAVIPKIRSLVCISVMRTELKYLTPNLLQLPFLTELNYKGAETEHTLVQRRQQSLLGLVAESVVNRTGVIKEKLPIGALKYIRTATQCYVCSKYIYNPMDIYLNIVLAFNTVPVKYSICRKHPIDCNNIQQSLQRLLFVEERETAISNECAAASILEVERLIEKHRTSIHGETENK
ncbi:uncharacterized protein NESG_01851 [Nematocida ausubeli]|uniref:Uncharacterized protein n=1 Tax=Nematocida ausubeli (strain ATCC PRA-371 / ERTm2) TaxID=1913371 RepID=A0A086J145_NEMA1|nr:uncharacterized protein NESG_01851 [Nematocida ausubeli]KAI5134502.1 hypothetical protein NEAUS07_0847 [Nematocida ausubeli]KFG25863.1 hypothetical protein NESG_01851 [Nematocida ausubeli]